MSFASFTPDDDDDRTNNGGANFGSAPNIPANFLTQSSGDAPQALINYNEKFANAGPTLYRDDEVSQTMATLISKDKPNPILVGPAGVGKTRIVEDIAYRIENNDPLVPEFLQDKTIYELPIASIIAGSSMLGQLEEKVMDIIDFAEDPDNKAIIFMDEIHQLVREGSHTAETISQMLKPALARGAMRTIGATTTQEYRTFNADPALKRRFSQVIVSELTASQTEHILQLTKSAITGHHNNKLHIPDSLIPEIVRIAQDYASIDSHQPDNALTLMDRASSDAMMKFTRGKLSLQDDPALLQAYIAANSPTVVLKSEQVRNTAKALATGYASAHDFNRDDLMEELSLIRGQNEAVSSISEKVIRNKMGLFKRTKPLSFLLAGPSGVGKSEIAKIISRAVTNQEPIILNMTEFKNASNLNRIIGSPMGYVGSTSKQEMPFDTLKSNPHRVIILDEFEKADKDVQQFFMSALDEGYAKDAQSQMIDFTKSIIFATTNAAGTVSTSAIGFGEPSREDIIKRSEKALTEHFPPEIIGRFTHRYFFNAMTSEIYEEILSATYSREIIDLNHRLGPTGLPDELDPKIAAHLRAQHFDSKSHLGARNTTPIIREYIEEEYLKLNQIP